MTAALKPMIPEGTIRSQDADSDFQDWVTGRPLTRRLLLVEVEAGGIKGDTQEKGRVTGTRYTIIHAAELRDPHEVDIARHRIAQIRGEGGFYAKQPRMFDATDAEKRESILDLIKDRASDLNLPMTEFDRRWQDLFGHTESAAETVQASRSLQHLMEFALLVGALEDKKAGSDDEDRETQDLTGDDPEGDEPDDEDAQEPSADEESTEQESTVSETPAALRSVPFQEQA